MKEKKKKRTTKKAKCFLRHGPFIPKIPDSKKQAPAAHQHWRSADVPHGMGNFSFMHQPHPSAAGSEEKTQSLVHPKQNKEGRDFPPSSSASAAGMVFRARGGGGSPELWRISRVGQSSWNGVSPCSRHSEHPEGSLNWGQLLNSWRCQLNVREYDYSREPRPTYKRPQVPSSHGMSLPVGCPTVTVAALCPRQHWLRPMNKGMLPAPLGPCPTAPTALRV